MSLPNYNVNSDKRVKLLLNDVAVSPSTAQSQYARPLNIKGTGITAVPNDTLNTFDVTFPAVPAASTVANVGAGTGTIYRDTTSNTYNLKTLLAGSNITLTNNANDITIAAAGSVGLGNPVTGKKWGMFVGGTEASSVSTKAGSGFMTNWNITVSGGMIPDTDTDGMFSHFTTNTSSGNVASYSGNSATSYLNPVLNPALWFKVKIPVITSTRMFFGFYDNPLPTNAYNYLNSHKGIGIMFDSAAFTTWQMEHNNGIATNTVTDTAVTVTAGTAYTFKVFCDNANTRWGVTVNNGSPIYTSSNIPQLSGWTYGAIANFQTMTSSARDMYLYYMYGESDL